MAQNSSKRDIFLFNGRETVQIPVVGNTVRWYSCGPTVYDESHIGHARSYIAFDVLRRILEDYFGLTVLYTVNITDIDDKIIAKAQELAQDGAADCDALVQHTHDVARKYEHEYFCDMDAVGNRRPTFVTRVSDYIDEIVAFVDRLVRGGSAYASGGSVYFDTAKYDAQYTNTLAHACHADDAYTGERNDVSCKKHGRDFALWKASKPGEPSWDSPWGRGRPGWHIECSAMAQNVFPGGFEIHSGGIDLQFPHHYNEVSQSQAYLGKNEWVRLFVHSGHLCVKNEKMSKSLKNFVTIKKMLADRLTGRQIRVLFLQHALYGVMDFSDSVAAEAVSIDKMLQSFVMKLPRGDIPRTMPLSDSDLRAVQSFCETSSQIDEVLCSSLAYEKAFKKVLDLVRLANAACPSLRVVQCIGNYVVRMCEIFGLLYRNAERKDGCILNELVAFRQEVKDIAKSSADRQQLFRATDRLRDALGKHGIAIEDAGGKTHFVDGRSAAK